MIYVSTHAGKRHSISEDAVLVGTKLLADTTAVLAMPESGFVCVADGVGGNRGGAQASRFILSALPGVVENTNGNLNASLERINDRLISSALEEGIAPQMATTLTGFRVTQTGYTLVHIGNTRAYIQQGKYLKQLTSDHTTYNWLLSTGQIEAANNCNKSEITNCFGGNTHKLLAKLYISECMQFSLAILTSDGVHEYVDLDTLEEIVSGKGNYEEKCDEIVQRAIENGSEDDLTVVIICPMEGSVDD